jgi:DNA-binding response OmpR family regulator
VGRVLLLEDEPMIAAMLAQWLAERGFVAVGPVSTNAEALNLLDTCVLDGAILDIGVVDGRSYPVARELDRLKIPFIFATGYSDYEIDTAFAHVAVLGKPFEFEVLSSLLHALLPAVAPSAV